MSYKSLSGSNICIILGIFAFILSMYSSMAWFLIILTIIICIISFKNRNKTSMDIIQIVLSIILCIFAILLVTSTNSPIIKLEDNVGSNTLNISTENSEIKSPKSVPEKEVIEKEKSVIKTTDSKIKETVKTSTEALSECIICQEVNCVDTGQINKLCETSCLHDMNCVAKVAANFDDQKICYDVYMQPKYGTPIARAMGVSECTLMMAKKTNDKTLCKSVSAYDTSITKKYTKQCNEYFNIN